MAYQRIIFPFPIGGRVEIKATRSTTNNLITLFTFNRSAWQKPQSEIILGWGYIDEARKRPALYSTVSALTANQQGLQIHIPKDAETVSVIDAKTKESLAIWDLYHIVGKFMAKFERLLFVQAETRTVNGHEEFHYNSARLLSKPSSKTFRDGFMSGKALIDIRMHLPPNKAVRNHGTGFRVYEHGLPSLFGQIDNLL